MSAESQTWEYVLVISYLSDGHDVRTIGGAGDPAADDAEIRRIYQSWLESHPDSVATHVDLVKIKEDGTEEVIRNLDWVMAR